MISRREKRQYKKRKHKSLGGRSGGLDGLSSDEEGSLGGAPPRATTPEPEEQEDDGPFAFRRNRLCSYHKVSCLFLKIDPLYYRKIFLAPFRRGQLAVVFAGGEWHR